MARRKRTVHPIIREIKRRMREIEKLKATANMLDIDLTELAPIDLSPDMRRAQRMTKRAARAQVANAFMMPKAP